MAAAVQKAGKLAAFIDAEHSLDLSYAKALGVDTDNLIVSQPMSAEEVFEILYDLVDHTGIVIVDSTAALMPQSDLENPQPGAQARIISQGIRKMVHKLSLSGAIIVFLSQLRNTFSRFGSSTISTGGKSLKFYSSIRLEVKIGRRGGVIRKGKPSGNVVKIKSAKNKTYAPFKEEEFNLIYGEGLSERKKR
jgi:recombination protein RecA